MADVSAQRMNAKIRDAQLMKVPYMLVVARTKPTPVRSRCGCGMAAGR